MFEDFEDLVFEKKGVKIPEPLLSEEDYKKEGVPYKDNFGYLKALCRKGFKEKSEKFPRMKTDPAYVKRIKHELDVFEKTLFTDYLLLNYYIVQWCDSQKIVVNPRGSAASSLVLFLLGISRVDPIKHGLIFERFLSADRISFINGDRIDPKDLGDIDLDIPSEGRDALINHLKEVFPNRFCKLSTVGKLSSPILMKECCKLLLEWDDARAETISKNIPKPHGRAMSLESAEKSVALLGDLFKTDPEVKEVALLLEGLPYRLGSHASAYLTMDEDINNCLPVQKEKNINGVEELLSTWDMSSGGQDEHVKVDLLSVDGIGLIRDVCNDENIDLETIDYEDEFIYEQLQDLKNPYGLFQISARINYDVTKKVKPLNIQEILDCVSLARPGALNYLDDYLGFDENDSHLGYEKLENILNKTRGVILFQETMMVVLHEVFGYDMKETNAIRKILSKKKKDELKKIEPEYRAKGKENKVPESVIDYCWESMLASADYSFCEAHACSYGVLAAQMVLLKFKYQQSFYLHCLRNACKKPKPFDEIFQITQELPSFGIKLLPPDIVKSGLDFQKEGEHIRFGLSSIKSISSKSLENLSKFIKEEKTNKFAIFQAGKNAKINIAQMTALIYVGALDSISFDTERRLLALECAGWYFLTEREQAFLLQSGEKYDFSFGKAYKAIDDWKTTEGKKVARATRKNTISKKLDTYRQIYTVNKENKRFAHWKFERSLLGYSYSSRLVNVFNCGSNISDVSSAISQFEGDNVSFLGEVQKVDKWNSKNNNKCLKLLIADELKSINAMKVGKEEIALLEDQDLIPKVGDIVVLEGKRGDGDTIWIDRISIQDIHVVFKKSDLTKLLNKKDV